LEIKVIDLGIGTGVGVDVHMHKVECELMGGSRGDKVRIWTDVPLHPPPTLVDGGEEYEVEAILDSQMCYNHLEYLVKWKGYDESHNQREVHTQVHAKPKIAQFHHKYPGTACHINVAIFDSIPFTRADLATSW
jgi:hypothetical protein